MPEGKRTQREKNLLMAAGEYLVASQVCLRGYVANLTPRNYPSVDIYAYNSHNRKVIGLQVKAAMEGGPKSWVIGKLPAVQKLQDSVDPFVFVWFTKDYGANVYIAKPTDIAAILLEGMRTRYSHLKLEKQVWAIGLDDLQPYEDKWEILGLD